MKQKTKKAAPSVHKQIKRRIRAKRPIHKRFFLHPAVIFMLLCVGVLLVTLSIKVLAVSFGVTAKVSAPLLTKPAIIQIIAPASKPGATTAAPVATTPAAPLHVAAKQILLSGECPKDSHIEFYRNGLLAGVAPCIGDPTFSIQIGLETGLNVIEARVFNITDDEGPISQLLYLVSDTPQENQASASTPSSNVSELAPFLITCDFNSLGFYTSENASWDMTIQGGKPPYSLNIDWGDGQQSTITRSSAGTFKMVHYYSKASSSTGYGINIKGVDGLGNSTTFAIMSIISDRNTHQAAQVSQANAKLNPAFLTSLKKKLLVAWPAYTILLLMSLSFWLGEREEYHRLVSVVRRRHKTAG